MESVSKKLKNVLKITGRKEELNEFIERLNQICNAIEVKLPNYDIRKISEEYIDSNWYVEKDLNDIVFYAIKNNSLIVTFANDEFETRILSLIEELRLDARYKYLMEDIILGVIIKERFKSGKIDTSFEEESNSFTLNNYSVVKCF